jgi:hypothetical protein
MDEPQIDRCHAGLSVIAYPISPFTNSPVGAGEAGAVGEAADCVGGGVGVAIGVGVGLGAGEAVAVGVGVADRATGGGVSERNA